MVDIVGTALDFIGVYGMVAILVLLFIDGAMLLPGFPGEIVLIMAVVMYAESIPELVFVILVTTAAGLAGSLLLYAMMRGWGARLVERFPKLFMMPKKRREKMEATFQRPLGQSLVFFLRLFPLTRVLVTIPAGLAKMPFVRFVVMTTIGLLIFHAGFLWFAYEVRRPGSGLGDQTAAFKEAYASQAWTFVEANTIIAGLVVIALLILLTIRHAIKVWRDHEESPGSFLGWLTTFVLFWGGVALAAALYVDVNIVYDLVQRGGLDLEAVVGDLGDPAVFLLGVAVASILLSLLLRRIRSAARKRNEKKKAIAVAVEKGGLDPDEAARRWKEHQRALKKPGPPPKAKTRLKAAPGGAPAGAGSPVDE